jgi:hypothetical protein
LLSTASWPWRKASSRDGFLTQRLMYNAERN